MRLGKITIDFGYVVDLDNQSMVENAKQAVLEDIQSAIRNGLYIDESDIPDFLIEMDNAQKGIETC